MDPNIESAAKAQKAYEGLAVPHVVGATTGRTIRIELARLPNLRLAQSTFGNWRQRHALRNSEKEGWITALLDAGLRPSVTPHWPEVLVEVRVELIYQRRDLFPDGVNVNEALKSLYDLLQPLRPPFLRVNKQSPNRRQWVQPPGWLGLIANDKQLRVWETATVVDRARAPLTVLELEG